MSGYTGLTLIVRLWCFKRLPSVTVQLEHGTLVSLIRESLRDDVGSRLSIFASSPILREVRRSVAKLRIRMRVGCLSVFPSMRAQHLALRVVGDNLNSLPFRFLFLTALYCRVFSYREVRR